VTGTNDSGKIERIIMQLALFIIFGALAVAGALNLLLQRHPINSALSLVVVMMSLAVLYWSLGAEFLAAAQVIVYSGAIMVFFVFVIMLLNAGEEERTHGSRAAYLAGIPGAAAIFCLLSFVFLSERHHLGSVNVGGHLSHLTSNISELSTVLFTKLLLPFEVTSVLILVAILGAVVLARKEQ
jgi:NADH-quinone oxidoreductase subunit J